jgi:hypothetical protein
VRFVAVATVRQRAEVMADNAAASDEKISRQAEDSESLCPTPSGLRSRCTRFRPEAHSSRLPGGAAPDPRFLVKSFSARHLFVANQQLHASFPS